MKYGVVLLVGLLLGLGLAAAWLLWGDRRPLDALLPQPDAGAEAPRPRPDSEPVAQEPQEPRPTFDFYTVLPQRGVELPGQRSPDASPPPDEAPAVNQVAVASPAAVDGGHLQAGAFRNAADAEALRARLALLGQAARIETVETDGRTLHRVRLGPYADAAALERARTRLEEAGIATTPAR